MIAAGLSLLIDLKQHDKNKAELMYYLLFTLLIYAFNLQNTFLYRKNLIIVTRIRTITCLSIFFSLLLIINYLYIWILAAIYADADTNQEENKGTLLRHSRNSKKVENNNLFISVAVEYWESVIAYFIAPLQILLFLLSAFSILLNSILVAKAPELLFPHSSTLSTKSNKIDEA